MADVFVALWKNASRLCNTGTPVKAWLVVTARNTGISRWRSLKRRPSEPLDEDIASDFMLTPRASDGEDCIAELVAALPEPDHEIFLRRYYLMESSRDIARALSMNEHAVNVRLSRGRAKLKQQYLARMGRPATPGKEAAQT